MCSSVWKTPLTDEPLDAIPGRTWINDYYLTPLLSVYMRLRP